MTKQRDQLLLSLAIARNLARSFSEKNGLPHFDPAPFCNLGDALFDVDGRKDFEPEFDAMAATLRRGLGSSRDVDREIAFRQVVATRRAAPLLWRYMRFRATHVPDSGERTAVKGWMTGRLRGRRAIAVASQP
jgi:hypothetical protein